MTTDMGVRSKPSTAQIEELIKSANEALANLTRHLTEEERSAFGLELFDALRNDVEAVPQIMDAWVTTIRVRAHPDFPAQAKEFDNLLNSGEMWAGAEMPAS